jgi:hypothetical protein
MSLTAPSKDAALLSPRLDIALIMLADMTTMSALHALATVLELARPDDLPLRTSLERNQTDHRVLAEAIAIRLVSSPFSFSTASKMCHQ